jgi:hypothetical protein
MLCYVTSYIWKAWQCFQSRHNILGSILFIMIEVSHQAEAFNKADNFNGAKVLSQS